VAKEWRKWDMADLLISAEMTARLPPLLTRFLVPPALMRGEHPLPVPLPDGFLNFPLERTLHPLQQNPHGN
jgi:hypothetical protein